MKMRVTAVETIIRVFEKLNVFNYLPLQAGEKEKWGTDESVFVNILTNRSTSQLQATFEAYKHVSILEYNYSSWTRSAVVNLDLKHVCPTLNIFICLYRFRLLRKT